MNKELDLSRRVALLGALRTAITPAQQEEVKAGRRHATSRHHRETVFLRGIDPSISGNMLEMAERRGEGIPAKAWVWIAALQKAGIVSINNI